MASRLSDLLFRLRGGKVDEHTFVVSLGDAPGQSDADREAMEREMDAEIARQLSEGASPETAKAALDEIARRHGGSVEGFKES
jgi:hypothetical protein